MVTLKQLRRMIELCNYAGQKDLSKELNRIRGRAFGRAYIDLTYVCKQAIDSYPNCPKELVAELNKIMTAQE